MKTLLTMMFILLALDGVMNTLIYASNHKASAKIEKALPLPRENIKSEEAARVTPVTRVESDNLALIEDSSLLGLTAGAFNPWFTPLSVSEQDTLKTGAQQNPELENMTAGDADESARIGWGVVSIILLFLVGIPF